MGVPKTHEGLEPGTDGDGRTTGLELLPQPPCVVARAPPRARFSTNRGTSPAGGQRSPLQVPGTGTGVGATMCDTQAGVPSA